MIQDRGDSTSRFLDHAFLRSHSDEGLNSRAVPSEPLTQLLRQPLESSANVVGKPETRLFLHFFIMFLFEILWQPHPPLPHPHRHPRHRHPRHDHHHSPPPSHHPLLLLMIIMIIESQAGDSFVLAFQCPSVAISLIMRFFFTIVIRIEPFGKSANHLQIGDNFRTHSILSSQIASICHKSNLPRTRKKPAFWPAQNRGENFVSSAGSWGARPFGWPCRSLSSSRLYPSPRNS